MIRWKNHCLSLLLALSALGACSPTETGNAGVVVQFALTSAKLQTSAQVGYDRLLVAVVGAELFAEGRCSATAEPTALAMPTVVDLTQATPSVLSLQVEQGRFCGAALAAAPIAGAQTPQGGSQSLYAEIRLSPKRRVVLSSKARLTSRAFSDEAAFSVAAAQNDSLLYRFNGPARLLAAAVEWQKSLPAADSEETIVIDDTSNAALLNSWLRFWTDEGGQDGTLYEDADRDGIADDGPIAGSDDEPVASALRASFSLSRQRCVAPCALHVDARATERAGFSTQQNRLGLVYWWNFGDVSAGTWSEGAGQHDKNIDTGFYSGHVYEQPGRYEISLLVQGPNGETASAKQSLVVESADAHWPGEATVCISATGDFAGCPEGARRRTTSDFDIALRTAEHCDNVQRGRRCLFRRGETFFISTTITPADDAQGHHIGAFGEGEKPVVAFEGAFVAFRARRDPSEAQLTIADLNFRGSVSALGDRLFSVQDRAVASADRAEQQLLLLRLEMSDLGPSALNFFLDDDTQAPSPITLPHHLAVVECSSLGGGSIVNSSENFLFLGNRWANSPDLAENILQLSWLSGAAIKHNTLGGSCHPQRRVVSVQNHKAGDGGNEACSRDFIVADNLIEACGQNRIDIEISPASTVATDCVQRFVVERNYFRATGNSNADHEALRITAQQVAVQSNIFQLSSAASGLAAGLTLEQSAQENHILGRPADVTFRNNSCVATGSPATKACLHFLDPSAERTWIVDNVFYDGSTNRGGLLVNNSASGTRLCPEQTSCNFTTEQNPFATAPPFDDLSDFAPGTSTILRDRSQAPQPAPPPINLRHVDGPGSGEVRDIGAVEASTS